MRISEIFKSIQGEGDAVGVPAVFVRFSGCNLQCPNCDSKYHKEYKKMTAEEVVKTIKDFQSETKLVVFTGGEPLLQQESIIEIVNLLDPKGARYKTYNDWWFQIETNGTIEPDKILNQLIRKDVHIQYNISPKLSLFNKNTKPLKIENCTTWGRFLLKFVISEEKEIEEIKKIQSIIGAYNSNIWLMAEGATKKEQEKNMPKIIKLAIKYNYNFTPRIHILVWDNKRKV